MDIGKLQFKLADRRYFELLRKCSLNITEAVKSRNFRTVTLKCNGDVFTPPPRFQQQFSQLSAIFFIKLSALAIFC